MGGFDSAPLHTLSSSNRDASEILAISLPDSVSIIEQRLTFTFQGKVRYNRSIHTHYDLVRMKETESKHLASNLVSRFLVTFILDYNKYESIKGNCIK